MRDRFHKSILISLCNLVLTLPVIVHFSAESSFAQYCTGMVLYSIRDETGSLMTATQLEKVTVKQIDSQVPTLEKDGDGQAYYQIFPQNPVKTLLLNPMRINYGLCGNINDLILEYKGKTMKLYFHNRNDWTRFKIDSLPFQDGIFELQKLGVIKNISGEERSVKCDVTLPRTSNDQTCYVTADTWKNLTPKATVN